MMTREWNRQSVGVRAAVVVLGAIAGCASGTTTFESSTNLKNSAPVTRLVLFESVQSPFFGGDLYRGFVEGMTSQLARCGVTASIEQIGALDLDPDQRIASTIESFRASSAMLVTASGGDRTRSNGVDHQKLRFTLKLLDVASNKVTWMAESKLSMARSWATDDVGTGARFATSIVSRLRADGVLTGCPSVR
jgi:hypothetical protein